MTTTFQSRWGYHPCDFPVYLILKRIVQGYWQARRLVAAHHRWTRKLPHNRSGPEPSVPAVYRELHAHPEIVREFDQARRPQADADQVRPLALKRKEVEKWLVALLALDEQDSGVCAQE